MLQKIRRPNALRDFPAFPYFDEVRDEPVYPKTYNTFLLTTESQTITEHLIKLSNALHQLLSYLGNDSLIFLSIAEEAWLCQHNKYPKAEEAYQYLIKNRIDKRFNGAIEVNIAYIKEFIPHLFWLTRCNGCLPETYFLSKSQNFIGTICKFGNLHLDLLVEDGDKQFDAALNASSFKRMDSASCNDNFSEQGVIIERKFKV